MKIAAIIVHYGPVERTKSCLEDVRKKLGDNRLILINNTASDLTQLSKIIPGTLLIDNHKNIGFGRAVNQGIKQALKDENVTHVFLMNNDLLLTFGGFNQLGLVFNKVASAGIVSPILHHHGGYDWGGSYNKWTGTVKHKNWNNKPKTILTVGHVAGAAMLISRQVIEKIGLFDERFFLYFEDLDFCLRTTSAGYTIHINPDVIAEHTISASSRVLTRTLHLWRSHLQFVTKYLFTRVMPTAYLYDLLIYPLLLLKALVLGK
jgi:GT2 family glycosyltransferase